MFYPCFNVVEAYVMKNQSLDLSSVYRVKDRAPKLQLEKDLAHKHNLHLDLQFKHKLDLAPKLNLHLDLQLKHKLDLSIQFAA